jgi:hypothetical protein
MLLKKPKQEKGKKMRVVQNVPVLQKVEWEGSNGVEYKDGTRRGY